MTGADGMAQVRARMAQIEARFGVRPPSAASAAQGSDFASALAAAQGDNGGSTAPTGSPTSADVIQDALKYLGVP
ncbi:MAG: hypothetical protein JWO68_1990, partial [Actinomycetia bacterium]|nr:hypothetical protein [Actinomycetes bacterium]